jgi:glutamate mutase epsilon subunit
MFIVESSRVILYVEFPSTADARLATEASALSDFNSYKIYPISITMPLTVID